MKGWVGGWRDEWAGWLFKWVDGITAMVLFLTWLSWSVIPVDKEKKLSAQNNLNLILKVNTHRCKSITN